MPYKKNTIISNEEQFIGYLGPTRVGKTHDYSMLKEEFPKNKDIFTETNILTDLGYLGIVSYYGGKISGILIPEKKPRKSKKNPEPELTTEQKESNKIISCFRIKVENAIGGAKRFGIVTQVFRNKIENFSDDVMEIASSLWNFYLLF